MSTPIQVRNPRTGLNDYEITPPDPSELFALCERSRQAQQIWQSKGISYRVDALQALKQSILERKEELVDVITIDTGRYHESVLEVDSVLSSIDRWCQLAPELLADVPEKKTAIPFIQLRSQLVPYALVGVISPWNFPLLLAMIDTIPALLAGCSVVVKPSEITPRFIQPMMDAIASVSALKDILLIIAGEGKTGADLINMVDLICFTGGPSTGQTVALAAAKRMIPAFLELGGKDPAIVLESADLELATSAILWGSVVNAGQSCLSIERIYVAETIRDRFLDLLVQKTLQLQLAYPEDRQSPSERGQIGPIISEQQVNIIAAHIQDALNQGATLLSGGDFETLDGGLWIRPTVLSQVNHAMKVMTDETFGPIMPVMSFSSVTEAIQFANESTYGLSAAVFGEVVEAQAVAAQIQAGAISINDAGLTALIYEGEKHAFKSSGLGGSRMGPMSLFRFLRKKALLVKTEAIADPWWF